MEPLGTEMEQSLAAAGIVLNEVEGSSSRWLGQIKITGDLSSLMLAPIREPDQAELDERAAVLRGARYRQGWQRCTRLQQPDSCQATRKHGA